MRDIILDDKTFRLVWEREAKQAQATLDMQWRQGGMEVRSRDGSKAKARLNSIIAKLEPFRNSIADMKVTTLMEMTGATFIQINAALNEMGITLKQNSFRVSASILKDHLAWCEGKTVREICARFKTHPDSTRTYLKGKGVNILIKQDYSNAHKLRAKMR